MLANISDDKRWWKVFWQPSTMWCSLLRPEWLYFFPFASSRFHGAAAGILNPENCRLTLNLIHWKDKFISSPAAERSRCVAGKSVHLLLNNSCDSKRCYKTSKVPGCPSLWRIIFLFLHWYGHRLRGVVIVQSLNKMHYVGQLKTFSQRCSSASSFPLLLSSCWLIYLLETPPPKKKKITWSFAATPSGLANLLL